MKRVTPTEPINDSPDARYHRHSGSAFLCNASEAEAFFRPEPAVRGAGVLLVLALIAMAVLALELGKRFDTSPSSAPLLPRKEAAARDMCGKGKHAQWLDATTVECVREF